VSNNSDQQNKSPISKEALAWAEFLYEEFMRDKHKQFSSRSKSKIIEAHKRGNK